MKQIIIKFLLSLLNSSWINPTPGKYDFVGNIDNFSKEYLESLVRENPHTLIREILQRICPDYPHTHEGNSIRPMNQKDINDLQKL